jgi:hypothetical protein
LEQDEQLQKSNLPLKEEWKIEQKQEWRNPPSEWQLPHPQRPELLEEFSKKNESVF